MDPMSLPANIHCSIARSLELLGQKWTLLILREALRGRTRFGDFQVSGVPSEALTKRLAALVNDGLLTRHPYQEPGDRTRYEYVLTPAGRHVITVMAALSAWSDEHQPLEGGPSVAYTSISDGRPLHLRFVDDDGVLADPDDVRLASALGRAVPRRVP